MVKGVGVQWAGKGAIPWIHRAHPELRIYQSEQECGDGCNDWRFTRYAWSLMKTYFQNGANAYCYWNIVTPAGGVSTWGWAQNALIVVDKAARQYRWTSDYWLMKHLSAFVRPGAQRLGVMSWEGYEDVLAFKAADGSLAIIAHNPLSEPMPLRISAGGRILAVTLPPDCFASLTI